MMLYNIQLGVCDVLLFYTLSSVLSTSVDILIRKDSSSKCPSYSMCKHDQDEYKNMTWFLIPHEPFVAAKAVLDSMGDVRLYAMSSQKLDDVKTDIALPCDQHCLEFFKRDSKFELLLGESRQSLLDVFIHGETQEDYIHNGLQAIILNERWTNVIILHTLQQDTTTSNDFLHDGPHIIIDLMVQADLAGVLWNIYDQLGEDDLNFVVLCSLNHSIVILQKAQELETMFLKTSRWLVVADKKIEKILRTGDDIPIKTFGVIFVDFHEIHCSISNDVLPFTESFHEVNNETKTLLSSYVINQPWACPAATLHVWRERDNTTKMSQVGALDQHSNLTVHEQLFPGLKDMLNQRTLIVATLEFRPFVWKVVTDNRIHYKGVTIDLVEELSKSFNFSYVFTEPEDQEFGQEHDGNWSGLVGLLQRKEADLIATAITGDNRRESVIDFTTPYFYTHSSVLLKKPDMNSNKWSTLVAPFRYEVHITILFSLIFSTIFLFVVEEVNPMNAWTSNTVYARRTRYGDILWYHFGALMANGGAYLPNTQSGRTILSCWWLFTVISAATYSGNLIAFLTDWREKSPFSSLAEMVEQDTYQWGTLGGSVYIGLFRNSTRPVYQKIWRGMSEGLLRDPDVLSSNNTLHKLKVLEGPYGYITDGTMLDLWRAEDCDLMTLDEQFYLMTYGLGLQNNSIYTKLFSEEILRLFESGFIARSYEKWNPKSSCETTMAAQRVDMLALQSIFYAAGVGMLLALAVLCLEILYKRKCEKVVEETITEERTKL